MVPDTVAPSAGEEMLTLGALVSGGGPFDTVTVIAEDVRVLPAASRATALIVCVPSSAAVVVFQATEYGALVSAGPAFAPSRRNWTLVTPTLSEALAVTLIVPETVAPFSGEVMLIEGAVVSGGGAFETVTAIVAEVRVLPAASYSRSPRTARSCPAGRGSRRRAGTAHP
jgi:hypothetical protein